jgi:hypothetical protein
MSTPAQVAEARLALARRLAMLRRDAGFTQAQTAHRIRYSRNAVPALRPPGCAAATFAAWPASCLGGDELAHEHGHIEALGAAARTLAAQRAQQTQHGDQPPPGIATLRKRLRSLSPL